MADVPGSTPDSCNQSFAEEVRYEPEEAALATEYLPRKAVAWNLSTWVEINPSVQFGAPIVRGTRIPISAIIADLGSGSPEEVAKWRGLGIEQVEDVRDYRRRRVEGRSTSSWMRTSVGNVGAALQLLEYPIFQVEHIHGLGLFDSVLDRWRGATDDEIVRWCGANEHVWVTQDDDSRSRSLRMGLLSAEGAAVIFVSPQPRGLQAQTELVVGHYSSWQELFRRRVPGYSAWLAAHPWPTTAPSPIAR